MFSRTTNFDKLLEKATSNLRLEPDWPSIMQLCDMIRQSDVNAKVALASIKKKITHSNPHVALYGLLVLESCVKNCGSLMHNEVGSKEFMEQIREIVKNTQHQDVRNKILDILQTWAFAFRNSPKYEAVRDMVTILKADGYQFKQLNESDAMFSADTAPEWADGERCHRCRTIFTVLLRKHHCRACGQVFCGPCSSKSTTLPQFGIEKDVRVCDHCYDKQTIVLPVRVAEEYERPSIERPVRQMPPRKTSQEIQEEEELQLALALSQSEIECSKNKSASRSYSYSSEEPEKYYADVPEPSRTNSFAKHAAREYDDEMSRYLADVQRERRERSPQQSIGDASNTTAAYPESITPQANYQVGVDYSEGKMDEFINALKSQVEIFVNRMKSNSSRGRPISNDTSVQTLFLNVTSMHSTLLKYLQSQDDRRVYYESLQDKLSQVKDARAALNALRDEHQLRLRHEAEMAERHRQIQMAQKLEVMRQQKNDYLKYQRELALRKIHEEEQELMLRHEQQKAQQYRAPAQHSQFVPMSHSHMQNFHPTQQRVGYDAMVGGNIPAMLGPVPSGSHASYLQNSMQNYAPYFSQAPMPQQQQPQQTADMSGGMPPTNAQYIPQTQHAFQPVRVAVPSTQVPLHNPQPMIMSTPVPVHAQKTESPALSSPSSEASMYVGSGAEQMPTAPSEAPTPLPPEEKEEDVPLLISFD